MCRVISVGVNQLNKTKDNPKQIRIYISQTKADAINLAKIAFVILILSTVAWIMGAASWLLKILLVVVLLFTLKFVFSLWAHFRLKNKLRDMNEN